MADNVVIPATGSGSATPTVATDDCGAGGHAQVIKLAIATDGSITLIPADATLGLSTNPTDRALRDLGKVDIAAFDAALPAGTNAIGVVSTKTALTASSPTAASVAATTGQAVASNANRKGLVLVNTSANIISLGFGASAVLNSGITLTSNGGSFTMDEYTFHTGAVNAIASVASSNLAIQEYT